MRNVRPEVFVRRGALIIMLLLLLISVAGSFTPLRAQQGEKVLSAKRTTPQITILSPRKNITVRAGGKVKFKWEVQRLPKNVRDWKVYFFLQGCRYGSGHVLLYSGPLKGKVDGFEWNVPETKIP
jgi:hypothetical protein